MSLPPQPWTFTADSYTGEVTLRDATGRPFLTIPAEAEMVEAKHAVGLVKRRWRMEGAEALARYICEAPATDLAFRTLCAKVSHGCTDAYCSLCDVPLNP